MNFSKSSWVKATFLSLQCAIAISNASTKLFKSLDWYFCLGSPGLTKLIPNAAASSFHNASNSDSGSFCLRWRVLSQIFSRSAQVELAPDEAMICCRRLENASKSSTLKPFYIKLPMFT